MTTQTALMPMRLILVATCVLLIAGCSGKSNSHPCDSCLTCEECVEGSSGPECRPIPNFGTICGDDGEVLLVDSCDNTEAEVACPPGQGECVMETAYEALCDCLNNWEGEDCSICPANWDPAKDCDGCLPHWEGDECDVCDGNWDLSANCDECVGNWDEATDCTDCSNQWVDEGNDCGTCPGNWDAEQDCAYCENHWEGEDCSNCPENWDPAADCNECLGNWDPFDDCLECDGNWDIDTGCTTCLSGWHGDACDVGRVYVDGAVASSGTGLAWNEALVTIQEGLVGCQSLNTGSTAEDHCEIWVAAGTYYVFNTTKADTVRLIEKIDLYGGFAGWENSLGQRDWNANLTIIDGRQSAGSLNQVYHVVEGSDDSILDGFTIRGGEASATSGDVFKRGAGMYNDGESPTVRNCEFTDNYAYDGGGGVYNADNSPVFEDCTFIANGSIKDGGAARNDNSDASFVNCLFEDNYLANGDGGAMFNEDGPVSVTDCEFVSNSSGYLGGAIININSDATIANSFFLLNTAVDGGGAICNYSCYATVKNCVFRSNYATSSSTAHHWGGGIYNEYGLPHIINCTFVSNVAGSGGGIFNDDSDAEIANCIIYDNSPNQIIDYSCDSDVTFSSVEGGFEGNGNINATDVLVNPGGGDYGLEAGAPCIDAADGDEAPALDMDGNPRVDDPSTANTGGGTPNYADMGALEYQPT